jgi:3'-phosphoadenosine 5'-phosphosulfate sulfotransferase (PAPS reductase)/FAD synthetase
MFKYSFIREEVGAPNFHSFIQGLLKSHKKAGMYFSAGRDSVALLHTLRPYLDRITLLWMNAGDSFPEIEEYAAKVKEQVPHFVEIRGYIKTDIKERGYPVDVLPVDYSVLGSACTTEKPIKLRAYLDCCAENISVPLYNYVKQNGFDLIFRGNRASEGHKTPGSTCTVYENTRFINLIEDWSDEDVVNYLREMGEEMHERFLISHSSLDCMSCTAFTGDSLDRIEYVKKYHPALMQELKPIFQEIDKAIRKESEGLKTILSM